MRFKKTLKSVQDLLSLLIIVDLAIILISTVLLEGYNALVFNFSLFLFSMFFFSFGMEGVVYKETTLLSRYSFKKTTGKGAVITGSLYIFASLCLFLILLFQ